MLFKALQSSRNILLLLTAASAAILGAALVSQYGFGLFPCHLCLLQRYPYMAIIALGVTALTLRFPAKWLKKIIVICIALLFVDSGIAAYHAGVEWGVFKGPSGCTNTGGAGQSLEEMRAAIMNAPLVSCGEAMAHFLGLSMAAWNAIAAFLLATTAALLLRSQPKQSVV